MDVEFIKIESFTSGKACISVSKKYKAHISSGYYENMMPSYLKRDNLIGLSVV